MPKNTLAYIADVLDILRARGVTAESEVDMPTLRTLLQQKAGYFVAARYVKVMIEWGLLVPVNNHDTSQQRAYRIDFEKAAELIL